MSPIINDPDISNIYDGCNIHAAKDNNGTRVDARVIAFSYNIAYNNGSFF
jgi:hypothetical protein